MALGRLCCLVRDRRDTLGKAVLFGQRQTGWPLEGCVVRPETGWPLGRLCCLVRDRRDTTWEGCVVWSETDGMALEKAVLLGQRQDGPWKAVMLG